MGFYLAAAGVVLYMVIACTVAYFHEKEQEAKRNKKTSQ